MTAPPEMTWERSVPADLVDRLARTLTPKTLRHSLAVRDHGAALAPLFGADPGAAAYAGLLHDCAKDISGVQCLELARAASLDVFPAERASPKLLHQRLGAHLAKVRFGVTAIGVLDAIACHTTGRGDMDALARCLFVADYTSPDRVFEGVTALREALTLGAPDAFRAVLTLKRDLARAKGSPEHPWAEAAYARFL